MALIVIDQGNRIQTPVRSLFPNRGVDSTTQSKAAHDSAGLEKQVHADGENFAQHIDTQVGQKSAPQPKTPDTYEDLAPTKATKTKPGIRAAQIMTHPVHLQPREATFKATWQRMQDLRISHLIVTDETGKPSGIISKTDIIEHGKDSPVSIANFYTQQMIGAAPETDVAEISATFIEYDINALPIFDEESELLGIVTRSDLLRLLISGTHVEGWA